MTSKQIRVEAKLAEINKPLPPFPNIIPMAVPKALALRIPTTSGKNAK